MTRWNGHRRATAAGTAAALQHALFGVLPAVFTGLGLAWYARHGTFAIDFHRQYWVVGNRVLHGLSPYDRGWMDLRRGVGFPYPAPAALWFVPFALLPHTAADWVFCLLNIAALMLTLRVVGVRDWRVYGIVMLWAPVVSAWQTANVTLLLGLLIALAWRYRERPFIAGALIGLAIATKVFMWPIALWLLATRRRVAFGWAFAVGLACQVVAWSVLGFDDLPRYISLSHDVTRRDVPRAYNLGHLAMQAGVGLWVAYAAMLLVGAGVVALAFRAGRERRERAAFAIVMGAVLLTAPVIWLHYFALLAVPLAVAVPRLSPIWALPIALFACPVHEPSLWQVVGTLGVAAAIVIVASRGTGGGLRLPVRSSSAGAQPALS